MLTSHNFFNENTKRRSRTFNLHENIRKSSPVSEGSHFILEHLLMDAKVSVGVEVVILTRHLFIGEFGHFR
jgi:hypothetical protein